MGWMPRWPSAGGAATDEESMRRVQASADAVAFARLVARWEGPVTRLCVRMCGDAHRGEDLAQEAFARVFANRQRFEPHRKFSTWLWRIALNLCHEENRRNAVRRGERSNDMGDEPLAAAAGAATDEPHGNAVRAEHAQLVRLALRRLPESHRAVVVLREYEGLKFREIAEVLDVPEGTVKWRMAEALTRLGEELRPILAGERHDAREPATRETDAPRSEATVPKVRLAL